MTNKTNTGPGSSKSELSSKGKRPFQFLTFSFARGANICARRWCNLRNTTSTVDGINFASKFSHQDLSCRLVPESKTCTDAFFMIFGRTNLWMGVSGAKFDAESDFEVRLAVAPQKPSQICKKLILLIRKVADFFFRPRKIKCRGSSETRVGKV